MALGPVPRDPAGLVGLLQLQNDGRFPAQLSELVQPTLDYLPFLAAGWRFRTFNATGAGIAPNTLQVATPANKYRLVWAINLRTISTGAIAQVNGFCGISIDTVYSDVFDWDYRNMVANERRGEVFYFPQPILLPPGSTVDSGNAIAAVAVAQTLAVLGIEFDA